MEGREVKDGRKEGRKNGRKDRKEGRKEPEMGSSSSRLRSNVMFCISKRTPWFALRQEVKGWKGSDGS
jgi:hypothetical protein